MIEIPLRSALFFAASVTFAVVANLVQYVMIGEVNRKLPESEQISYLFGYYGKYGRVVREYRRLYPTGRLHVLMKTSVVAGLVLLVAFAWDSGFLGAFLR